MGDPSLAVRDGRSRSQVLRECPMTPLRLPSSAAAAACRLSDRGREHGFGALRLPALRFVRTASGSARPRPRLQRHAPRLGGSMSTGGLPGRRVATRIHMAAASPFALQSLHRFRCDSSCPWRGVCPQNIATVAITALCALSGAHVGVSRPRCRWQLYGWRHPTTPSREPHERSSYQSPCRHWPQGRFCRLSLPLCPIRTPSPAG